MTRLLSALALSLCLAAPAYAGPLGDSVTALEGSYASSVSMLAGVQDALAKEKAAHLADNALYAAKIADLQAQLAAAIQPPPLPPLPTIPSLAVACTGTDAQAALQNAFTAAKAQGKPVLLTGTCLHSAPLTIDSIVVYGQGPTQSILKATTPSKSTVYLKGTNPQLYSLKVDGSGTQRLEGGFDRNDIVINGTGAIIQNVHVYKASGVGISLSGAINATIRRNLIEYSYADSIHIAEGSQGGLIERNETVNSGDDSVGLVAYGTDVEANFTIQDNYFHDSRSGRGIAVLGGRTIKILRNTISDMHYAGNMTSLGGLACLYIGAEGPLSYNTNAAQDVLVQANTLINCGGSVTGHAAVLILNQQGAKGLTVGTITLDGNTIVNPAKFGYVPDGNGKILAKVVGSAPVYTDTKVIYQSFNSNAGTVFDGVALITKKPLSAWVAQGRPVNVGLDPAFVAPPAR